MSQFEAEVLQWVQSQLSRRAPGRSPESFSADTKVSIGLVCDVGMMATVRYCVVVLTTDGMTVGELVHQIVTKSRARRENDISI